MSNSNLMQPISNCNDKNQQSLLDQIATTFLRNLNFERAVSRIANLASSSDELMDVYGEVHSILKDLTSAENFFVAILDEENGRVTFPYYKDGDLKAHPYEYMELEEVKKYTITSLVLEAKELVHLSYDQLCNLKDTHGVDIAVGGIAQDWMGVPLTQGDSMLGAIVIQSYSPGFRYSRQDEQVLWNISHHVASALQKKQTAESLVHAHEELKSKAEDLEASRNSLVETNQRLNMLVQQQRQTQTQLKHNATHDSLTGLPNRLCLLSTLEDLVQQNQETGDNDFALLFLDLDQFKVVNDSLGHLAGDCLLNAVAERLKDCVRKDDLVARLGGDEFCILLGQGANLSYCRKIARRILREIDRPMIVDDQRVVTSTSIGIAHGQEAYQSADEMLRDADTALYQVKAAGRSGYAVFDQTMREKAINRMGLEQALRQSIDDETLDVYFQPITDMQTGSLIALEVLSRWDHEQFGKISPATFIPIAEEINLINRLTDLVLTKSIRQLVIWRREFPQMRDVAISINVSNQEIESGAAYESIARAIEKHRIPPSCLKLEVTESLLLNNLEVAIENLTSIANLGVKLSLDDFGTGFSSLSCLNSLPLHELKIDLSFVRDIVTDGRSFAIVQMIVAMSQVMNLKVVAEGIETESQRIVLQDLKVDYAQGYLMGAPMNSEDLSQRLVEEFASQILNNVTATQFTPFEFDSEPPSHLF